MQDLEEMQRKERQTSLDVERMRTVFTQLDSMREELVSKLKTKFSEVSSAEARNNMLEREVREKQNSLLAVEEEMHRLQSVLQAQERERDSMQV